MSLAALTEKLTTPQRKAVTLLATGATVSAAAEAAGVHRNCRIALDHPEHFRQNHKASLASHR